MLLSKNDSGIYHSQPPEGAIPDQPSSVTAERGSEVQTYLKKSQDVGHHDGHGAGRGSDHAHDFIRLGEDGRVPVSTADVGAVPLYQGLHERQGLLQSVRVPGARVQDPGPQRDVWQQLGVLVDQVDGEHHGLQTVDALLLLQLTAGCAAVAPRVHRK